MVSSSLVDLFVNTMSSSSPLQAQGSSLTFLVLSFSFNSICGFYLKRETPVWQSARFRQIPFCPWPCSSASENQCTVSFLPLGVWFTLGLSLEWRMVAFKPNFWHSWSCCQPSSNVTKFLLGSTSTTTPEIFASWALKHPFITWREGPQTISSKLGQRGVDWKAKTISGWAC